MNMVLLSIIILLLVVCIILIVLLININKKNKNKSQNNKESYGSNNFASKKLDISDTKIPNKIESMDHHSLFQACKKVFESFKALDYAKKSTRELEKVEWHSWQVSLLIGLLKADKEFFIPKPKQVFHESIFESSEDEAKSYMYKILQKYNNNVNIDKTRDDLCNDIIWSSKEVSYIFLYMLGSRR